MVFGYVKQSGGHVSIYSELGHGTTVKLYFPRVLAANDEPGERPGDSPAVATGKETILLVEDDADVRAFVNTALESAGYKVPAAEDGPAALTLINDRPQIDMLLTDVVMPGGMSGPEVVAEVAKLYPGINVLFTSGYTENAMIPDIRIGEDTEFLGRPYTRDTLVRRVRKVLDG
jgi:DNA-binding NtrC family response regulator